MAKRLKNPNGDPYIVFVAMPFGNKADPVTRRACDERFAAISGECENQGCQCDRVDQFFGAKGVVERAQEMMGESDIYIVDLTDERPNVPE
ncbi:MAG: hypothetical protein K2Y21_13375 [Phycisphaerales bacterium]|nr:hypothetical protein [Phycisphaerales bacterium]